MVKKIDVTDDGISRRVVMVGHENVNCVVQQTPLVSSMQLYVSDGQFDQFQQLVARALNTWDTAPSWVVALDAMLTGRPSENSLPTHKQMKELHRRLNGVWPADTPLFEIEGISIRQPQYEQFMEMSVRP